jgi:hypothetical protein
MYFIQYTPQSPTLVNQPLGATITFWNDRTGEHGELNND